MTRGESSDPLGRLAVGITIVAAAAVLYFALFPFDFVDQGRSSSEIVRRFSVISGSPWALREVPANILLTIPFGFGLGGLLRSRTSSTWKIVLVASMCAFVLSCGVELAQSAWLLREPSVGDIVANTAGGAVGAWLWTRMASRSRVREGLASVEAQVAWRRAWLVFGLVPAGLLVAVTIAHRTDSELAGWDQRFPIVLGNEATGNRPWHGSISRVALADRVLSHDEIARVLDGAPVSQIAPGSGLVDHSFRDDPNVPPGWELRRTDGQLAPAFFSKGLEVGPGRWLQTDGSAAEVSRRIDAANSFTLLVDATTASPAQTGPARLVSISSDTHHTNLTLAQEGVDLVVRVRTAFTGDTGISPEFVVPGVFRNDTRRRVVVTYRPSTISVTVDRVDDTTSIALLPETVPLVATFTDEVRELRASALGNVLRQLLFATILFAPWTVWVALVAFPQRQHRRGPAVALVIVPIVSIEAVLAWTVPGHSFRVGFVLTTAAAATLFVVFATPRPSPRA